MTDAERERREAADAALRRLGLTREAFLALLADVLEAEGHVALERGAGQRGRETLVVSAYGYDPDGRAGW